MVEDRVSTTDEAIEANSIVIFLLVERDSALLQVLADLLCKGRHYVLIDRVLRLRIKSLKCLSVMITVTHAEHFVQIEE